MIAGMLGETLDEKLLPLDGAMTAGRAAQLEAPMARSIVPSSRFGAFGGQFVIRGYHHPSRPNGNRFGSHEAEVMTAYAKAFASPFDPK